MGHGWERGERERQRGVWRVLNCICLTFWHVQHRLKITFAAEKCRTIRWRRQSVEWIATGDWKRKEEGAAGWDYSVTQRSTDKIDNWQMQSEHLGALICVHPSPCPLPLFGRKLHFVKAFLRLVLTKQRNAWEMARNKPWQAVNMQIVFSTETQFYMICQRVYKYQEEIQVQVRRLALSLVVSCCRGTLSL